MHDLHLERFLDEPGDGPIKTFTLRGIKDSPPYLHDGRCLTLEDTVEFFNLVLETEARRRRRRRTWSRSCVPVSARQPPRPLAPVLRGGWRAARRQPGGSQTDRRTDAAPPGSNVRSLALALGARAGRIG